MIEYNEPPPAKKGQKIVKLIGGPCDGVEWPVDKLTATIMTGKPPVGGINDDTKGFCYLRRDGSNEYDYIGFVSQKEAKQKYLERIQSLEEDDPADWWKKGQQDDQVE